MKKKNISHKSQTDWDRVDKLGDRDIDFSDNPEVTAEMFAKAVLRKGLKPVVRKTQVTLRIDEDVLTWFKKQGKGYQTRINSLLKAYKDAHQIHSVVRQELRNCREARLQGPAGFNANRRMRKYGCCSEALSDP